MAEFLDVAARPQQRLRIRAGVAAGLERLLRLRAMMVVPLAAAECPPCRDADDVVVIATAMAARADYVVTLDGDLLDDAVLAHSLAERGIQVVRPCNFLASLK